MFRSKGSTENRTAPPAFARFARRIIILGAVLTLLTRTVLASVILPSLPPGSQYQLAFVTADGHDATSNSIADYNQFVAQEAAANALLPTTTWAAIASTSTVDAFDNAATYSSIPIYNTHGELVASGANDFWFPVHTSLINYDQYGLLTSKDVWTGSNPNGSAANALGVPFASSTYGRSGSSVSGEWTFFAVDSAYQARRLYAISAPITVPVPEPSALTLFGLGCLVCGSIRLVRWRSNRNYARGKWHTACVAILTVFMSAQQTNAGSITYSDGLFYDFLPSSLTVPQWDQAAYPGQTLNSVTIDFSFEGTAGANVPNDLGSPSVVFYSASGSASLTLPNAQQLVASSPTETVGAELPAFTSTFLSVLLQGTASQSYTSPLDLAAFIGNGSVWMPVSSVSIQAPPPPIGVRPLEGGVSLAVTYEWMDVPEPSSTLLAGVGVVLLGVVRRRRWSAV